MIAAEVTLKSSSVPLFQRGNFRPRILTPLLKKEGKGRFLGGVRQELFGTSGRTLAGRSKRSQRQGARRSMRGGVLFSYVDAKSVERNKAYESFSTGCLGVIKA
jgi:hypothetical protein